MNYTFFVIAEDMEGLYSDLKSIDFYTKERYKTAEFVVEIQKQTLNSAERQKITNQIAFLLSLPPQKVVERYNYDVSKPIV